MQLPIAAANPCHGLISKPWQSLGSCSDAAVEAFLLMHQDVWMHGVVVVRRACRRCTCTRTEVSGKTEAQLTVD
jgi:hypothetical protein